MDRININKKSIDGLQKHQGRKGSFDLPLARFIARHKNSSVFFSKHGIAKEFFTDDSKIYLTPAEYRLVQKGEKVGRFSQRFDSALSRKSEKNRIYTIKKQDIYYLNIKERYSDLGNYVHDMVRGSVQGVSAVRMWNLSIVGAVIFGMFTMTMIYRYLGQGVSAAVQVRSSAAQEQRYAEVERTSGGNVIDYDDMGDQYDYDIDTAFITKLFDEKIMSDSDVFEQELREMVKGYPIEKMVPEIAKKDRTVAAFMVAIAKKESNWGKRVPVLDGQDCFNYWGYRGIRDRMGTGGHTCFDSTTDAVDTVAKRISTLVEEYGRNTPSEMVVWKCGSDCAVTGGQAAANKWISDVAMYFNELNKE